jgi:redox-sensitive bicupin YhaK (pirin superfamily)
VPRIPDRDPAAADRQVVSVTTAPSGFEGEGFPVRRAFAGVDLATLDPFVHMDQMGEVDYAPGEPKGTPWHPHRGFGTVTYMSTASSGTRTPTAAAGSSPTATPSG